MSAGVQPQPRLVSLDVVDSTNAEAMRRALAGERGPLWITAARQTAGKGRSGRTWVSDEGNFFASLLFALPTQAMPKAYQLSLVAGVAAVDAIRDTVGGEPQGFLRVKWPNDLLLGREKVGGILVESSAVGADLAAVIGIGINLVSFPGTTSLPATNLARHGFEARKDFILSNLARAVAGWLGRWQEGSGFAEVRSAWLDRAGPIGEACSVTTAQGRVEGRFDGIDADGALLLVGGDGRRQRYTYGDVTLSP